MNILKAMMWVGTVLYVIFQTSAVYEYLKVLPLPEFIKKMKQYEAERKYDFGLSYKIYYITRHDSFFTRLITCPYCLGAWVSLGVCYLFSCLEWFPVVYLGGLSTYYTATLLFKKFEKAENDYE